ncbi:MAG TPA: 50S ribosomal protein L25 [Candidatus Limnocylindrales bacterium]|nr:50S ribosomal protein L25 [Candidatus Limnocylindrales bacterium]
MSTRPELAASRRALQGKAVRHLRRDGVLPGVVYGNGQPSEPVQVDERTFSTIRRHAGGHALLDLTIDGDRARPVMVQSVQEHPVRRSPLHVDFLLVSMTEAMTVEVPIVPVGESFAVDKLGGTLLHLVDRVRVRALPGDLPSGLEIDISPLENFELTLHARDLRIPAGVQLVTDADEPVARVQAPRVEEAPIAAPAEEAPAEATTQAPSGEESGSGD